MLWPRLSRAASKSSGAKGSRRSARSQPDDCDCNRHGGTFDAENGVYWLGAAGSASRFAGGSDGALAGPDRPPTCGLALPDPLQLPVIRRPLFRIAKNRIGTDNPP